MGEDDGKEAYEEVLNVGPTRRLNKRSDKRRTPEGIYMLKQWEVRHLR